MVADDLTGAADSAAPFVARGMSARVGFGEGCDGDACVVARSTNSRERDPASAAAAVTRAAATFPGETAGVVSFKKVDSLLRGNPRSETEALLGAWRCTHAVVAPAFPAMGRTTEAGRQKLWGQPLTAGNCEGQTPDALRAIFGALPCVLCDALTDEDLDEAVRRNWAEKVLWVGSAGLAASLARRLGSPRIQECPAPGPVRSILVVIGSRHPVTLSQVQVLGGMDCGVQANLATAALRKCGVAVMRARDAADWPQLVDAASTVPAECTVLSGGDTAEAVLLRQGTRALEILGQPWPGIPLGRAGGGRPWVIVKSGAFGDAQTLRRTVRWLRGGSA